MHAPSQPLSRKSYISITFGPKISSQLTPINIDLTLDIFSQKNQNIRFNIQQMLKTEIIDGTLMIELVAKKGLGAELADKIMTYLQKDEEYIKATKDNVLKMKAIGKGDTCYLFLTIVKLKQLFQNKMNLFQQLKQENIQPNLNHSINLKVKSQNNCQQIRKLLDTQGSMRAFFDSLSLDFTFQKTKLVEKTLEKLFQQMQVPNVIGPLKSFSNLNLALNFASSAELDKYQSLRVYGKIANKVENSFFTLIKGEFNDQVKLFYFHPVLSLTSKIHVEQVNLLLEALYEESQ